MPEQVEDKKHNTHLSKDGQWYPSYEEMVAANRRHNQLVLESKGLVDAAKMLRTPIRKKTLKARSTTPRGQPPVRRSSRQRNVKPENSGLSLDHDDFSIYRNKKRRMVTPSPIAKKMKMKKQAMMSPGLGESDRKLLEEKFSPPKKTTAKLSAENLSREENDWLDEFNEFLLKVNQVSPDNARNVMKQSRVLVSGQGVAYHHWPKNTKFLYREKVHLGTDFDKLYDRAVEFEYNHGRDLGNGWLMRHPIRKLQLFQQYQFDKHFQKDQQKKKTTTEKKKGETKKESKGKGTNNKTKINKEQGRNKTNRKIVYEMVEGGD